jgi:opacity protein-like surface antigen
VIFCEKQGLPYGFFMRANDIILCLHNFNLENMMNKKILLATALLAAMPFAASANDNYSYSGNQFLGMTGPYVTLQGGWNNMEDDSGISAKDGWLAGIAAGGKTDWARAELEATYRKNEISGGTADSVALMGNAYWDIETNTRVTPYIGAGIGTAYVDVDTAGGGNGWEFAYQGMAGANVALTPQWAIGAEYRYYSY